MGLADMFYNELNRFRDKLDSKEEEKKIVRKALKKSLIKFKFLWEDQMKENICRGEKLMALLKQISEDFLDLAVEVEATLNDKDIVDNLRGISKDFMKESNKPRPPDYLEVITGEIGMSLARIDKINEKLRD